MKLKPLHKTILIHLTIWIFLSIFPLLIAFIDLGEVPSKIFLKQIARPILFYGNYFFLVPLLLLKRKFFLYIIISLIFLFIFNYIFEVLLGQNPFPNQGPTRPTDGLRPLNPFFGRRFAIPAVFSLTIFLLGGIFALVADFNNRDRLSQQLKLEKTDLKLQSLRNQLNPHFLFNTLNSIYALVRNKSNDAPEAVITLSELMRYMLYEADANEVALEKELNYIQNYIALQRLRLKNSEDVKINIHGNTKNLQIYPLVLITFIENAFKYGTDFKGNTCIDIKINIINDTLTFNVKNSVGIFKADKDNSGVGLKNIKNQLEYLYKDEHDLSIIDDKTFYDVCLILKLNTK